MLDLTSDFVEVIDDPETVMLSRVGTPGEQTITGALRRKAESQSLVGGQARVLQGDVTWHLPCQQFTQPPRVGDQIVDAANQHWTILQLQFSAITGRWQCHARNVTIAAGLDQLVDLHRAVWSRDQHGAPISSFRLHTAGLPAHVQLLGGSLALVGDRRDLRQRFRILLAQPIDVEVDDRVLDAHGCIYCVTAVAPPDRLAAPLVLQAEPVSASD